MRLDSIPRDMFGKCAVLIDGSWWLVGSRIGSIGSDDSVCIGAWLRRIDTVVPPVLLDQSIVATNSVLRHGSVCYESIRPILWKAPKGRRDDVIDSDPLRTALVDDGSLGAYVGESRMLAKAPKRTKGKR